VGKEKPATGAGDEGVMVDGEIQAMSDADYAAWRLREIRRAYRRSVFGFGLSIVALALAVWAKLEGW